MTINKINVNGQEYDLDILVDGSSITTALGNTATVALAGYRGKVFAGTTSTAANTAAKAVTIDDTLWQLQAGDLMLLTSTNTNSAANATFAINSGDAKSVKYAGSAIAAPYLDKAGSASAPQLYIYDGTSWNWLSGTSIVASRLSNTAKVGDTNKPVYFDANGVPQAISYTIAKSVPSDAKFTDNNSASLQVGDTTNKKINTSETTGKYIQFTGGINKFTVGDGTSSFDVAVTPSIANNVTGSSLTSGSIITGSDGNSGVKASGKSIVTTVGNDDTTVPTSKAVATAISNATSGLTGAMHLIGTTTTALSDGAVTATLAGTGLSKTTGFVSGDVVLYSNKEFVWTGAAWELLGDEGSYALKTVTITGTGALGGGGAISSNQTITHNTSGVTAASYGPTANVTGTDGTTIKVPQITVDQYGHVTAVTERTYTSKNTADTNQKVKAGDVTFGNNDVVAIAAGSNLAVAGNATDKTITVSHSTAGTGSALTTSDGTAGAYAKDTEYTVLTGVTVNADANGHITGVSTTRQKIKDTNTTYTGYNIAFQNNSGTTVDTYKALTSPNKTLKAGSNVQMSAASNVITISATDTTYSAATTSANGLMSSADKAKLDKITMTVTNGVLKLNTAAL